MPTEIERKFIVRELPPDIEQHRSRQIEQFYLLSSPWEVRMRRSQPAGEPCTYNLTIKVGSGLTRREYEVKISPRMYSTALALLQKRPLKKVRYAIPQNGHVLEVDVYADIELMVAEVEFPSTEEAEKFRPPVWVGTEVTEQSEYSNQQLFERVNRWG